MEGSITVKSKYGEGSNFMITIPIKPEYFYNELYNLLKS